MLSVTETEWRAAGRLGRQFNVALSGASVSFPFAAAFLFEAIRAGQAGLYVAAALFLALGLVSAGSARSAVRERQRLDQAVEQAQP